MDLVETFLSPIIFLSIFWVVFSAFKIFANIGRTISSNHTEVAEMSYEKESEEDEEVIFECENCSEELKEEELLYFESTDTHICKDCIEAPNSACENCNHTQDPEGLTCAECDLDGCYMCMTTISSIDMVYCENCIKKARPKEKTQTTLATIKIDTEKEMIVPLKPVTEISSYAKPIDPVVLDPTTIIKEKEPLNPLFKSELQ